MKPGGGVGRVGAKGVQKVINTEGKKLFRGEGARVGGGLTMISFKLLRHWLTWRQIIQALIWTSIIPAWMSLQLRGEKTGT